MQERLVGLRDEPAECSDMATWLGLPMPRFVPLWVPVRRQVQVVSIVFFSSMLGQCLALFGLAVWCGLWPVLAVYAVFIGVDRSFEEGGRSDQWMRRLAVWRQVAAYFPMRMVREVELDPARQYLFAYHPHGIFGNGAVIGFGTEALGFSELFPGIAVSPVTLRINFFVPFYREIAIALGFCAVSKRGITNLFRRGKSCVVVVGGAEEALFAKPRSADLVLKNRMGFVAMAIRNGASLVPVYAFGENDTFDLVVPRPGSIVARMQQLVKRAVGFTVPLFHGRNIFTYNYGFLPKRHPVTIVGKHLPTD